MPQFTSLSTKCKKCEHFRYSAPSEETEHDVSLRNQIHSKLHQSNLPFNHLVMATILEQRVMPQFTSLATSAILHQVQSAHIGCCVLRLCLCVCARSHILFRIGGLLTCVHGSMYSIVYL